MVRCLLGIVACIYSSIVFATPSPESLEGVEYNMSDSDVFMSAVPNTGMPQNRPLKGTWNIACVGVWWQNRDKPTVVDASCANLNKLLNEFYSRNSRGLFHLNSVVATTIKVPYDCDRKNQSLMTSSVKEQVRQLFPEAKPDIFILPQECTGPHAGGGVAHVKSAQGMTATHEVGHLVHLQHSGVYRKQPDGTFKNDAYADRDSIMGRIISRFITAPQYYWQGWLNADEYTLYKPETKEYTLKHIEDLTDKGGLITVIVPPNYANGKYVFISSKNCFSDKLQKQVSCVKMHHAITGSWGGSIRIAEFTEDYTDNNFSGLTVKVLRDVGKKTVISIIPKEVIITPTPVVTVVPTKTPTVVPTKTPTVVPTKTPTVVPTKTPLITSPIPACIPEVVTNGAWAVFGSAMKQYRSYHKATQYEISQGNLLITNMKRSKDNGITVENDIAMMAAANNIRGTLCRVTLPKDSYILLYANKGVNNYNGPNMIFRETPSSKIVVIGPHDDSDYTHTVTKFAIQHTNALALFSNGQSRHVDSDSDFMHHSWNLGSHMVWQLDKLFPKSVILHTHGMANPKTILYRSRSKILGAAYEAASTNCTGMKDFTPRFNAYYQTERGINSGFYLKVEMPVKFYHNRPEVLACIVKYIEGKYSWAYDEIQDDVNDQIPDVSETDSTSEDEPNETPED